MQAADTRDVKPKPNSKKRKSPSVTSDDDQDEKPNMSTTKKSKKQQSNTPGGGLKPSDPEITMFVIDTLLESYNNEMRTKIAQKYGVTAGQLSNQWRMTTKPRIRRVLEAEFLGKK